jgi:hypothetical protein
MLHASTHTVSLTSRQQMTRNKKPEMREIFSRQRRVILPRDRVKRDFSIEYPAAPE